MESEDLAILDSERDLSIYVFSKIFLQGLAKDIRLVIRNKGFVCFGWDEPHQNEGSLMRGKGVSRLKRVQRIR